MKAIARRRWVLSCAQPCGDRFPDALGECRWREGRIQHHPALQLGLYSMDSPESERYLAWWYHHRRFVPFKSFEGGIRARWFAVVWGETKYCILYEFVTRQAHSEFIAKVESLAHDKSHVTGDLIPHTIHDTLLSQSVGVKVPLAQPMSR